MKKLRRILMGLLLLVVGILTLNGTCREPIMYGPPPSSTTTTIAE